MAAAQQALLMAGTQASRSATIVAADYLAYGYSPCGINFKSDGTVWVKETGSYTQRYTWLTGTGTGSNYDIRVSNVTGDTYSTGTTDTWLSLGSDRTWTRSDSVWADRQVWGLFEIRDASTLTVLASATISLECYYGSGGGGGG